MQNRVFVTGSEGFIGSHLVEALVRRGYRVNAFMLYDSFGRRGWLEDLHPEILSEIEIVPGDLRDFDTVQQAMEGCSYVCHLGALIGIPYSYRAPKSYLDTNLMGTLNVLEAARHLAVNRVIHTSTSEVFGSPNYTPIDEAHPIQAQSPYAASKVAADQLVASYFASYNLPVVTIRPFNTFGPRQSIRAVIPTIISQGMFFQGKLEIGSMSPQRDFTFVGDTVAAFLRAIEVPGLEGTAINLGTGTAISVEEIVSSVGNILGIEFEIAISPERLRPSLSEIPILLANNDLAKRLLGWEPSYKGKDGFEQALSETVLWFNDFGRRSEYLTKAYGI